MTTLNAIRTITVRAKPEGFPETTGALKGLTAAQDNVARSAAQTATVTDTASKRSLSAADAYRRQTLALDQNAKMQDRIARATLVADRALQQGLITQRDHAQRLTLISERYSTGANNVTVFGRAVAAANDNMRGFAASAGPVAGILSALGPAGLAAAAALGAMAIGFKQAADAALQLADRAGKLNDFSETTGFTVTQLQALEKAGAQVGVSAESVNKGLERFSVAMEDVRNATGNVYDSLRQIDPALAEQLSRTESLAEAWDLLAEASRKAGLEQRNQLARQVFGRGGIEITRLLGANADAGGLKALIDQLKQVDLITKEQAESWDNLGDAINENMKAGRQNIAATFTGPVLEGLNTFSRAFLELSRIIRDFNWSPVQTFLGWLQPALNAINPVLGAFVLAWQGIKELAGAGGAAPLKIEVNAEALDEGAKAAAKWREETVRSYNEMKRWMDVVGEAATLEEKEALKKLELAAAAIKAGVSQEYANRAFKEFKEQMSSQALDARISALGDLATTQEVVASKQNAINEANKRGAQITNEETAAILAKTAALHEFSKLPNQLQFERDQMDRTAIEQQVASRLRQEGMAYEQHMNGALAAMIRQNAVMTQTKTLMEDAASGFVSDLARGVDLMTALANMAGRLGQQLIDMGTKQALSGLFSGLGGGGAKTGGGGQIVMQASSAIPSIGLFDQIFQRAMGPLSDAAKTFKIGVDDTTANVVSSFDEAGFSIEDSGQVGGANLVTGSQNAASILGSALGSLGGSVGKTGGAGGGLGGLLGGINPAGLALAGVGVALSMFSASQQAKKAEEQRIAQAKKAWEDARFAADSFKKAMEGIGVGALGQSLQDALDKYKQFAELANAAGDLGSVRELQDAYNTFVRRSVKEFVDAWGPTLDSLNAGLGPDSPFVQGVQLIKDAGKSLTGFVEDAKFVFGNESFIGEALALAQQASQKYALSLLGVVKPMSDTQQQLEKFKGIAQQLPAILVQLGMSAEAAAAAVQEQLTVAIDQLRMTVEEQLRRDINSAQGADWYNTLLDINAQFQQLMADAATLGTSTALIDEWLKVKIQQTINQAQLTGALFDHVLVMFPQLAGQLVAFSEVVQRTAQDIAAERQTLEDRLFAATNDASTLSGALAAFDRSAALQRAQTALENIALLEEVLAAERLNIVIDFNRRALEEAQRAADEQKRIMEEARNFLQGVARRISEYTAGLLGGTQSPLSPQDRLSEAQSAFSTQLALAQGGDRDALSGITQFHSTLIEAARAFHGSSAAFQTIFDTSLAQLQALPSQVSPEQLIVDAVTEASDAIVSAQQAMQMALTTVLETGNLQNISQSLLNYLPQIDTNTDGAISFTELQAALGGTYATGTLRGIFNEIDGNGNGLLEKSELIKIATQGMETGTDNVVTNTEQMEIELANQTTSLLSLANIANATINTVNALSTVNSWLSSIFNNSATSAALDNAMNSNLGAIRAILNVQNSNRFIPNPATFAALPTFHQGGLAGDEMMAVLQRGEFVTSRAATMANLPLLRAINSAQGAPILMGRSTDGQEVAALLRENNKLTRALIEVMAKSGAGAMQGLSAVAAQQKATERAIKNNRAQPKIRNAN